MRIHNPMKRVRLRGASWGIVLTHTCCNIFALLYFRPSSNWPGSYTRTTRTDTCSVQHKASKSAYQCYTKDEQLYFYTACTKMMIVVLSVNRLDWSRKHLQYCSVSSILSSPLLESHYDWITAPEPTWSTPLNYNTVKYYSSWRKPTQGLGSRWGQPVLDRRNMRETPRVRQSHTEADQTSGNLDQHGESSLS